MKVKANYGISCDKGYFETGEVFEIDAKDLPMYGDAVTAMEKALGTVDSPPRSAVADMEPTTEEPEKEAEVEKPRTARTRTRARKS